MLNPDNIALWVGIIGGIIGIFSWYRSAAERYRSNIQKKYAAEREIGHLKAALESLSANVNTLCQMYESQHEQSEAIAAERSHQNDIKMTEVKMLLAAIMAQLGSDSSQLLHKKE